MSRRDIETDDSRPRAKFWAELGVATSLLLLSRFALLSRRAGNPQVGADPRVDCLHNGVEVVEVD
jgi:hypothetical protein